jgi:hypothetical protein
MTAKSEKKATQRKSQEQIDREMEEDFEFYSRVERGEFVPCQICGAKLLFYGPDSRAGVHPGISCENGHKIVTFEFE